ncbi:hypothetical protein [Streptomyces sp. BBFR109]|uniref:hypothetical protein n=1 Tax=Streptomyces sp. BBFR109 TaxID=3448172 RepID=UPI003F76FDB4
MASDLKDDDQAELAVDQKAVQRYEEEHGGSALAIKSLDDIKRLSTIFIESGMFKGDKSLSLKQQLYQAGVKIIAGVEFGIQPFAAMRGINIINGNAEMSANLMAAKVKKHPKYDYKVKQWDKEGCVLVFYEIPYPGAPRKEWYELGESSFDQEDAVTAQLAGGNNWKKFARNMYFARAMSNGVRIHCPDVFYGAPVYVEGEISGEFETKGEAAVEEEPADKPTKAEPQEGEIIEPDELCTDEQLEKIKQLCNDAGAGPDWYAETIMKIDTYEDAEKVIRELETKMRQEPTERVWR